MTRDEKHDVALMRYSVISPLISSQIDACQSLRSFFREAAEKTYTDQRGKTRTFSAYTIERWYRAYQREGFDGLLPKSRADAGKSRVLDDDCKDYIRHMKFQYPRMPATVIYRSMIDNGLITKSNVSESTVNRFINQLSNKYKLTNNIERRRYERPHINEVWCGDSSVGPRLITPEGKKKLYIMALIDDASRMIVGIDIFFNDNFINLMTVMKSAVSKYGRPKVFNFDNGAAYKNKQMELLAARIGSTINYCHPYSPEEKAKIERWFRTMKDQWMSGLDMRGIKSLDALRESLYSFVNEYNQTKHSALNGDTPINRFFSEPEQIRRIPEDEIDTDFMLEIERKVSADSVIVLDGIEYEVNYRYAKQRIRIRYSPDMQNVYVIDNRDGSLTPIKLLNKAENSNIKREKIHLYKGDD